MIKDIYILASSSKEPPKKKPRSVLAKSTATATSAATASCCRLCLDDERAKASDIWINCDQRKCCYWVHSICTGFVFKYESDLKDLHFYCPDHIKKFMKAM